jgi:hypothetical protein
VDVCVTLTDNENLIGYVKAEDMTDNGRYLLPEDWPRVRDFIQYRITDIKAHKLYFLGDAKPCTVSAVKTEWRCDLSTLEFGILIRIYFWSFIDNDSNT